MTQSHPQNVDEAIGLFFLSSIDRRVYIVKQQLHITGVGQVTSDIFPVMYTMS